MRTIIKRAALPLLFLGGSANAESLPFFTIVQPEVSVYSVTYAGNNGASRWFRNGAFDPLYTLDSGASVTAGPFGPNPSFAEMSIAAADTLPGGLPVNATFTGSVDARTGLMRGSATHGGASSERGGQYSVGSVRLGDTVWFSNTSGADAKLKVFLRVDGEIVNLSGSGFDQVRSILQLSSCAACSEVDGIRYAATGNGVGSLVDIDQRGSGVFSMTDYGSPLGPAWTFETFEGHGGGSFNWLLSTELLIPRGGSSLGLKFFLDFDCRFGVTCNFGSTQGAGFGPLPDGLTFTSASGHFLKLPDSGGGGGVVPEPAAWALMITGFGLVGAAARRRRTFASA
jgi:hypothetical protein